MVRATLQECISLFDSNIICQSRAVRGMEQLGEWMVAREYWLKLGRTEDAQTCKSIADAISRGDSYREAVKHLNEWVDKTVAEGIMEKDEAIGVIYPELSRIHKSITHEKFITNEK